MTILRQSYILVRATGSIQYTPQVPETWEVNYQDNKWCTIHTAPILIDGETKSYNLACYRANANSTNTQGMFALFADEIKILDWIKDRDSVLCAPAIDVWQARSTNPTALAALRRWPVYRINGFVRDGNGDAIAVENEVVRLMKSDGFTLPNPNTAPLPWNLDDNGQSTTQALAKVRVTAIHSPALDVSIAGFQDYLSCENQATSGSV